MYIDAIIVINHGPPSLLCRRSIQKERARDAVFIPLQSRDTRGLIVEWNTATVTSASIEIAAQDTLQAENDTLSFSNF